MTAKVEPDEGNIDCFIARTIDKHVFIYQWTLPLIISVSYDKASGTSWQMAVLNLRKVN